jgi:hypothetical protein
MDLMPYPIQQLNELSVRIKCFITEDSITIKIGIARE